MTEAKWLTSDGLLPMLEHMQARASQRKLRLFAIGCCRQIWHLLVDPRCRAAVEVAERLADGQFTKEEVESAWSNTSNIADGTWSDADEAACAALTSDAYLAADGAWECARRAILVAEHQGLNLDEARLRDAGKTGRSFCALLRHIIGNPFRPYPAPPFLPATVVQLAQAIYNGADASFALHDALLEAGHPVLAEHFHQEQTHPKGCWVVDLILGKN